MGIRAVRIEVDRATFARWNAAIAGLRRQLRIPIQVQGTPGGLPPLPRSISVAGVELLLEVGKVTAPSIAADDPARLFALLKYATRIDDSSGTGLLLSREVRELDSHKKRVLSDELGCGMAAVVCQQLYDVESILDLREATRRRLVTTSASRSRQPDYIAMEPAPSQTLHVVEAKGTQGRLSYCCGRQIPAGCGQVAAVRVSAPGWGIGGRLVVGTVLRRLDQGWQSEVVVGDPEEDQPDEYRFEENPRTVCARDHYARVARLIGDERLAAVATGEAVSGPSTDYLLERQIGNVRYVGSQLEVGHEAQKAGIFVGIETGVHATLLKLGFAETDFAKTIAPSVEGRTLKLGAEETPAGTFATRRRDGTVLEVWNSPVRLGSDRT